jgi:hypothetical protein
MVAEMVEAPSDPSNRGLDRQTASTPNAEVADYLRDGGADPFLPATEDAKSTVEAIKQAKPSEQQSSVYQNAIQQLLSGEHPDATASEGAAAPAAAAPTTNGHKPQAAAVDTSSSMHPTSSDSLERVAMGDRVIAQDVASGEPQQVRRLSNSTCSKQLPFRPKDRPCNPLTCT